MVRRRNVLNQQTIHFLQILNREPIDSSISWEQMSSLARKQNLLPLFFEAASFYIEYVNFPGYIKDQQDTFAMVSSQIQRTNTFLEVYEGFNKENIFPIVLKGITCRKLYGEFEDHRPSSDEDILIPKETYPTVKKVLENYGYICTRPNITSRQLSQLQEVSFYHPKHSLIIEVHINPFGTENKRREQLNDYFSISKLQIRCLTANEVKLYTMDPTDSFLFLILHMYKHFQYSGVGLRQMIDVLMFYKKYENQINWTTAHHVLHKNKAEKFFNDITYLGNTYLGFHLPQHGSTCCAKDLIDELLHSGVFGGREQSDIIAANTNLSNESHSSSKIRLLLKAAFPSKKQMLNRFPYLEEKPYLLPIAWLKRMVGFFKKKNEEKKDIIEKTLTACSTRSKMLQKYEME